MALPLTSKAGLPAVARVASDHSTVITPTENLAYLKNDNADFQYSENLDVRRLTPTETLTAAIGDLYEVVNKDIIGRYLVDQNGNKLGPAPDCIVTLESDAPRYEAFAAKAIWSDRNGGRLDHIALVVNKRSFSDIKYGASTIAHEICHLVQFKKGKVSQKTPDYHNAQFRDWMRTIGLQTAKTGKPGDADVGAGMSHYIIPGGPFDREMDKILAKGFDLPWIAVLGDSFDDTYGPSGGEGSVGGKPKQPKRQDKSKSKFQCPNCKQIARANYKAKLLCGMEKCEATPMTAS